MEPTYISGLRVKVQKSIIVSKIRYTYQNYGNSAGFKVSSEVN